MKSLERARELFILKRFHLFGLAGSSLMRACVVASMVACVGAGGGR